MQLDPYIDRFMAKVKVSDECWEWNGSTLKDGYGRFALGNLETLAHRVSYRLFKGNIPDGLKVCHACDNRLCVRPEHLFLGTQKQNMEDALSKDRCIGPKSSLTSEDIRDIKALANEGLNYVQIGGMYHLSKQYIRCLVLDLNWKGEPKCL